MNQDSSVNGVYYHKKDYAGLVRRVVIALIDMTVVLFILMLAASMSFMIDPEEKKFDQILFYSALILSYLYLVLLKRSLGTPGYWLTGVRIVDLSGNRPSVIRMTGRFLWLIVSPLSLGFDLVWLTSEETRQTLRDKIVGTYVIKKKVLPAGSGRQTIKVLSVMGLYLRLREVERSKG